MRVPIFILLMLAAPVVVIVRGHFGRRALKALALALVAPILLWMLDRLFAGFLHAPARTTLPPQLAFLLDTLHRADLIALPCLVPHVLALGLPAPRHLVPCNAGYFGQFRAIPASVPGLIADWLRLVTLVALSVSSLAWHRDVMRLLATRGDMCALLAAAAFLLMVIARLNRNVLPGFAGPSQPLPLWRFAARLGHRSRAVHSETLAAIFSRRSSDLRAIDKGA